MIFVVLINETTKSVPKRFMSAILSVFCRNFADMTEFTLNCSGRLLEFRRPAVMAIINATPDSFYAGARNASAQTIERAVAEGADILDIGAYSSRPGAADISPDQEWQRLKPVLEIARQTKLPVSIDTFRADVAEKALDNGADIINDISGGMADPLMADLIARRRAPYIIMHMRGTPQTMQTLSDYTAQGGVAAEVLRYLAQRVDFLEAKGIKDIIVDPGFGFAKTVGQNYELLRELPLVCNALRRPLLAGLSRKSMFYKPLGLTAEDVLPHTTAANLMALQAGAAILRVHDVAPARWLVDYCG